MRFLNLYAVFRCRHFIDGRIFSKFLTFAVLEIPTQAEKNVALLDVVNEKHIQNLATYFDLQMLIARMVLFLPLKMQRCKRINLQNFKNIFYSKVALLQWYLKFNMIVC
jgi:hypothetical protein